ncbi:MAG: LysR family transcriptional regulator [Burkholderiales bacterium]|nr:LysR family transcriptional regulator [Burkholderiales bacterium]
MSVKPVRLPRPVVNDHDSRELKIRLYAGSVAAFGPGKADLLEAIMRTGSISAAGRELAMSYRRCWNLVDEMNACFAEPLVMSVSGGAGGGGARVTEAGQRVLLDFRALEAEVWRVALPRLRALRRLLR